MSLLRFALAGCWSRRIDREQHLVYRLEDEASNHFGLRYPLWLGQL